MVSKKLTTEERFSDQSRRIRMLEEVFVPMAKTAMEMLTGRNGQPGMAEDMRNIRAAGGVDLRRQFDVVQARRAQQRRRGDGGDIYVQAFGFYQPTHCLTCHADRPAHELVDSDLRGRRGLSIQHAGNWRGRAIPRHHCRCVLLPDERVAVVFT